MGTVTKLPLNRGTRWVAVLFYRTDNGIIDVEHAFEELSDIEGIVERGPDWHTLDRVEIRLRENYMPELTIEQSRKL